MLAGYSIPRCGSTSLTAEGLRVGEPNKTTTQPVGLESYHIQGKLQTLLGKNDKNYFQNIKNIQGLQLKAHLFRCVKVQAL